MRNGVRPATITREIFFHSHAVQQSPPLYIELSTIYRQTDTEFISVLNNLRNNQITAAVQALNKYVKPDFDLKITKAISPWRHCKSGCYERNALEDLKGELITYKPDIVGDFPEKIFL
jgi:hypothetical protein